MTATSLSIVDFHSHHVPSRWRPTTTAGLPPSERARWERINAQLADLDALNHAIAAGDLAARVINTPTALIADAQGNVPLGTVERINDDLAAIVARRPGTLHGLATIDAFSGDAGARELTRAVRELGLRGAFVDSAKGDVLLDAPEARPTLATAAKLGVPVFVHPVNPQPLSRQLAPYGRLGTLLARGTVNAAALIALLESGTFDDLPELRVVVTTLALGGILLAGGLGDDVRRDAPALLRRHVYVDTMGFHPALIRASIDLLGADHVVVGSDWPIVSEGFIAGRVEAVLTSLSLDEETRRGIAGRNALRLLGVQ